MEKCTPPVKAGCCGCCCLIVLLFLSITIVDQTQWCLKYDFWTSSISDVVYTDPGLKFIGPLNAKICYPNTNKYVYFRFNNDGNVQDGDIHKPPIQVRTKDGLVVALELEYVYKLRAQDLRAMYMLVGDDGFFSHLVHLSQGIVTDHSTVFTAEEFFGNRTLVSNIFEVELRKQLASRLFLDVQTLQLQPAHFPPKYSETIDKTQAQRQDIEVATQERTTKLIQKSTQLKSATKLAEILTVTADGDAQSLMIDNTAKVEQYAYQQEQEATGNSKVYQFFADAGGSSSAADNFMNYFTVNAFKDRSDAKKAIMVRPTA